MNFLILHHKFIFTKKKTHFTLTKSKLVNEFLGKWQNTIEKAFKMRLKFTKQQVSLHFSCFLFSWHGFVSFNKTYRI